MPASETGATVLSRLGSNRSDRGSGPEPAGLPMRESWPCAHPLSVCRMPSVNRRDQRDPASAPARAGRLGAALLAAGVVVATTVSAVSAQGIPLIRDAEIETHVRAWADPVFAAAGLDASSVDLYFVNEPTINAFVAGGQNIFLHTGLIVRAGTPDALVGVIAHEAGHIAAGHLVRTREAAENAAIAGLATTLITIGASALGGGDDAISLGAAGMSLGENIASRMFLQHSRSAEYAADLAALQYLAAVGRPARPMVELLVALQAKEQTLELLDPYARTHPLTQERIQQILDWTHGEQVPQSAERAAELAAYDRLVAKIVAFTDPPEQTLQRYGGDDSVAGRYARAIAYYRKSDLTAALSWIDELIAQSPEDHYFHELRGQILLENGRVSEASESYRRAAELAPEAALILVGFAQAELETADDSSLSDVIGVLERVLDLEPANAKAWRLLAAAHSRAGNDGLAMLATAEHALIRGRAADARRFAERALKHLPPDSPAYQRADDIGQLLKDSSGATRR